MTETLHNRPVDRDKLSAALKRNMARRKAGARGQGPVTNEVSAKAPVGRRVAFHGEPRAAEETPVNAARPAGRASHQPAARRAIAFSEENAGSD